MKWFLDLLLLLTSSSEFGWVLAHQSSVFEDVGKHDGGKLTGLRHGTTNYEKYHKSALIRIS